MTKFKWGLIGPGRIARRFANALNLDCVGSLHAVASRNAQRASEFAADFNIPVIYNDYASLLKDGDIDAVYIATPHAFHYQCAKECLLAGKPVLCEKPLTVTAEQTQALIDIARERNVFLMEAMWTPFTPIYKQVREWIDAGKIGEPRFIQSTFGFKMPRDPQDRLLNKDLAGGVLLDMGVYNIAVSNWCFGSTPNVIQASGFVGNTGVDELAMVNMGYPDGRYAQFTCNILTQTNNTLWLCGSEGRICIDDMFWNTSKATLLVDDHIQVVERPFAQNGFEYEIAEAEKCIKQGDIQSSLITHDFTLNSMRVMDEILSQLGVTHDASLA